MIGAINQKTNYFILFLLFFCIKLCISSDIKELNLTEATYNYNTNKEEKFKIISKDDSKLPNYLKIELEASYDSYKKEDRQYYNDYIISYYKDSEFKDRKQLSQSNLTKSVMWLNKAQIKGEFYLSVECFLYPCVFSLKTIFKEKIELNFDRPYTYYITEENKEMKFNIIGKPEITFFKDEEKSKENCKISIWAKGNKELKSDLNATNLHSKKHRGYHAYIIDKQKPEEINLNFTVIGKVGDFIEVGALFINGENYVQGEINFGVLGLFKKGVLDYIKIKKTYYGSYIDLYDREALVYPLKNFLNFYYNDGIIRMENSYGHDEYFYSFEYKDQRKADLNKLNIISPLINGAMYNIYIDKSIILGLIPMKPDDDIQYLTYYTREKDELYNASIIDCDNYPFCRMNETNEKPLLYYKSSSIIYNKNDYKNISPINKRQKILILKNRNVNLIYCNRILANMYTNKNNITLIPEAPLLKNIKGNTEENFIISLSTILPDLEEFKMTKYNFFLNVEILSGEIEVEVEGVKPYKYENKYLYEKTLGRTDFFKFKIKSKKNSVYNIATYYEADYKYLLPQTNSLIRFNDTSNINLLYAKDKGDQHDVFFILFYALNSKISVKKKVTGYEIEQKRNFFQYFSEPYFVDQFEVKLLNRAESPNLFSISVFRLDNSNINYFILDKGIPRPVLFNNSKFNMINYMYLHDEENEDLKINFTLFDDIEFNLEIFFNDKKYQGYNNISKTYSQIELSKDVLKNNFVNNQPCKINFIVSQKNYNNNPIMEIVINTNNNGNSGSPSKTNGGTSESIFKNKTFIIGGSIILVLLIILIIAIGILCYTKKVNKDLNSKITSTSFKEGGTGTDDREDYLLD